MVGFKSKKIETERTLGERLAQSREAQHFSLSKAACDIKISKEYLEMLERGEYDRLPGDVYTKNFIKSYSCFLGLDPEELLALYRRERAVFHNIREASRPEIHKPTRILSRFQFLSAPKIFRNALISCIVCICLLYLGVKVEAIIRPPDLEILYPASDILLKEKYVDVQGKTRPGAHVIINGQDVLVGSDGSFFQTMNLNDGINEIMISAKKDHSKDAVIIRRVVVQE